MKEFLIISQSAVVRPSGWKIESRREAQLHRRYEWIHNRPSRSISSHNPVDRYRFPIVRPPLSSNMVPFRGSEQPNPISTLHEVSSSVDRSELAQLLQELDLNSIFCRAKCWANQEISLSIPNPEVTSEFSRADSKMIVSFIGRVMSILGDWAQVALMNESTGERFEAECETSFLHEKGIKEGMEFLCKLVREGQRTVMEFAPLPPKILTAEELEEISREVDSRLQ